MNTHEWKMIKVAVSSIHDAVLSLNESDLRITVIQLTARVQI